MSIRELKFAAVPVLAILTACSTQPTSPAASQAVKVLMDGKPPACPAPTLAHPLGPITARQGDRAAAIDIARKEAAQQGAEYLSIHTIRMYAPSGFTVAGMAYRCATPTD